MFGDLTSDFETTKSNVEAANAKVSKFTKSPVTTAKYKKVVDDMKQIMISGGPGGGIVDDSTVKKWISEAKSVVADINSLYQTYIVGKPTVSTTGKVTVMASPAAYMPGGEDTILGMNKWVMYGIGGLAVAVMISLLIPKKSAQVA